jgi:hypothetical protein
MRNANKIVFAKPEGNRSLIKPRHGWEDNIKIRIWVKGYRLNSSGSR